MDWDRVLALIEEHEWDYHVLPHYGFVAEWRPRYEDLRDLILSEYEKERTKRTDEEGSGGRSVDAQGGAEAPGVPDQSAAA